MKNNIKTNQFLPKVDFVDLTWLINKENFNDDDFMDEKFLYFETRFC